MADVGYRPEDHETGRHMAEGDTLTEQYLRHGLAIVPLLPHSKQPFAGADHHRVVIATDDQLADWLRTHPRPHNWAILGSCQIDPDSPAAMAWAQTHGVVSAGAWVLRTRRGYRLMYRAPADCPATSCDAQHTRPDLLGPRSFGLIPPSIHPSGHAYAWVRGHSPADIAYPGLQEPPETVMAYWHSVATPATPARDHRPAPGYLGVIYEAIVARLERDGVRLWPTHDGGLQGDCPFHQSHGHKAFTIHPERGAWCFAGCLDNGRLTALAVRLGVSL